ncbi:hypothetical protein ABW19_dt0204709 [Dactylella cylindrospora]|nr:hypothetical protein ABW19_dt0204709 [Dactylella cylindrospora]
MAAAALPVSGYGCIREVLDPEDPDAEPGALEEWQRYKSAAGTLEPTPVQTPEQLPTLFEQKLALEDADETTGIFDMATLNPFGLDSSIDTAADATADATIDTTTIIEDSTMLQEGDTTVIATHTPELRTLEEIGENARINSLFTQAALQKCEEEYRAELEARGIPFEDPTLYTTSLIHDQDEIDEIERMIRESSQWKRSKLPSSAKSNGTTVSASLDEIKRLVLYHATPEWRHRSEPVLKQLVSESVGANPPEPPIPTSYAESNHYPESTGEYDRVTPSMAVERFDLELQLQEAYKDLIIANRMLAENQKFLAEYPERRRKLEKEWEEKGLRNQRDLRNKLEREEREQREREERERQTKIEEQKRKEAEAKAKAAAEAERKRQEAIRAKEAYELLKKRQEDARRAQEEAQRKAEEERQRKEEAQRRQKEENERAQQAQLREQQEKAERERKAAEVANHRVQQQAARAANLDVEVKNEAQKVASTMPYLNPDVFEELKSGIKDSLVAKSKFTSSAVALAPQEIRGSPAFQRLKQYFDAYSATQHSMRVILARVKAIKALFNSMDLSKVKYAISKKVTQMVGSNDGYKISASEVLKLLNELQANMPAASGNSIIAVSDFNLPRQGSDNTTAPPALFITLYSFLKTALNKGAQEGPESQPMMKALGMMINAIMGGKAKFWPCNALTLVIYMRFWEFSPTLFGAMGNKQDIGYRVIDGSLESSTDVNRRAEVAVALWCHMGILRPSNLRREQAIVIDDVYESLQLNLRVPLFLRDELHYINLRTIMAIAPWTIRAYIGLPKTIELTNTIVAYCREDSTSKLRAFASLLISQMEALVGQGYNSPSKRFGCDEWKYWDIPEFEDTNKKRASVERLDPEEERICREVIRERVERERKKREKSGPEGY